MLELSSPGPGLGEALRARGLHVEGEKPLRVGRRAFRPLAELTCLLPPAPMEAILTAALELGPEEISLALLTRYPVPLLLRLAGRPVHFGLAPRADGSALLWIRRRP